MKVNSYCQVVFLKPVADLIQHYNNPKLSTSNYNNYFVKNIEQLIGVYISHLRMRSDTIYWSQQDTGNIARQQQQQQQQRR